MFIALEGIDGAGKTTTLREIARLTAADPGVVALEKKRVEHPDPVVHRQLVGLHDLLWDHRTVDPFHRLGPRHWAYLMAAWFATYDDVFLKPAIADGRRVFVDSWTYKFLARLETKRIIPGDELASVFAGIRRPDRVVRLRVAPAVALRRKGRITVGESGNCPTGVPSAAGFLQHQQEIDRHLDGYAAVEGWYCIDTTDLSTEAVAERVLAVAAIAEPRLGAAPTELRCGAGARG